MYNEIIRLKWKIYLIKNIENKLHHLDVDRADAFALLNCARYVESYGGLERGKETKQNRSSDRVQWHSIRVSYFYVYKFNDSYFSIYLQSFLRCTKIYY